MDKYNEISMAAVFQNKAMEYGEKACVAYRNEHDEWVDISWNRMNEMIRHLAYYLLEKGVQPGDKIAVFSPNRYEWWIADMAILSIGAVNVPIYATNTAQETRYILDNSESRFCFVGTAAHLDKVLEVRRRLPNLMEVIVFDQLGITEDGVTTIEDAIKRGELCVAEELFDQRLSSIQPADLCTFIYTSGTTGDPKGVMLSHHNIMSNVRQFMQCFPEIVSQYHEAPSFLPLSHAVERTAVYYCQVISGNKVYFIKDLNSLLADLQDIRPTFMASVPRVLEKMYEGILAKASQASPLKRKLFAWALGVGKKNVPYICKGQPRTGLYALKYKVADRLVFSKLKKAIGLNRIYFIGLGGAPAPQNVLDFFLGMDISCCDAYGLSETSPLVSCNRVGRIAPGTVGVPVMHTEVKASAAGELLVKGPQVMAGYYRNEEATREVFTPDGYLKTGDTCEFDSEGNLKITGRIKDIIITSGGKNISPQNIEGSLLYCPYVNQVAVVGDGRKYLSALIVPDFAVLESWARENGLPVVNRSELIGHEKIRSLYAEQIDELTRPFGPVEQIKKFTLLDHEWTQNTGELTPTLKVKRRVITANYSDVIDRMYK